MSLVVFTGGVRSGKSAAAQDLARRRAVASGQRVVVAVFGRESDTEMAQRIERHRTDRPDGFETLVADDCRGWTSKVSDDDLLVLDCLGTLVGRLMEEAWSRANARLDDARDTVDGVVAGNVWFEAGTLIEWVIARRGDSIVVTNEVGDGVVPAFASGRLFRDVLGTANRRLVCACDAGYLCVAGRLIELECLPRCAMWPED